MITAVLIAYNNEDHISEAVHSALRQTVPFERSVIVDDGSTDQTRPILADFAARHDRIDVILHDQNQGPGGARNTGIDQVGTDFFCFLDGDDVFFDTCCETMSDAIADEDADFWAFNGLGLKENATKRRLTGGVRPSILTTEEERHEALNWVTYPWNKLYRTEFIRTQGICFPPGRYQDVPWCVACILTAQRIVGHATPVVHYRIHGGSLLQQPSARHFDILSQWRRATDFVEREFGTTDAIAEQRFVHLMHVVREGRIPQDQIPDYVEGVLELCGPLRKLRSTLTSKKASRGVRYIAQKKWL